MREKAFVVAALLALTACARKSDVSPAGGSASVVPSALPPRPEDLKPLSEVVKASPGTRVETRAFLWLQRPNCPPCPSNTNCEPCPPPFFQFSERPNLGPGAEPGAIVLADLNGPEPKLDVKSEYFLEGVIENNPKAASHPFLRVQKIGILTPAPAK